MKSEKLGLILSHIHVKDNDIYKFDILNYTIEYFNNLYEDLFIVVSGHGHEMPYYIQNKLDGLYWEETIDENEIGRGHPKFCIEAYKILIKNGIEKSLKVRSSDIITNKQLFYKLIDSENLILSEQTCLQRRMIGDLLMFGNTKTMYELWSNISWDYSKSGLYNLFDSIENLANDMNQSVEKYLKSNCFFVNPKEIGWHSIENNWNVRNKTPMHKFSDANLWGMQFTNAYYGGF